MNTISETEASLALSAYARQFYERGWMWGTSGNLSVRLDPASPAFVVTPSAVNKGTIEPHQLIIINGKKPRFANSSKSETAVTPKPSAETQVHQMFYELLPECGAVFHVHPPAATYVSGVFGQAAAPHQMSLPWIEMMKGVGFEEGEIGILPIFPNWQDISKLAAQVKTFWQSTPGKKIPAFLIYNHGLTAWGRTMDEARNHLEVMEYVCDQRYRSLCTTPPANV